MQIDNISQLMRYNALQTLTNINGGISGNNSEFLFESILSGMLQDTKASELKNKSKNNKVKSNGNSKETVSLDSLSLQPQQMARMMRSLVEPSTISTLNGNSIGSAYNGYYGTSGMMQKNNSETLMLGYMLGKMSQNSYAREQHE